jgi:hypothetical protein
LITFPLSSGLYWFVIVINKYIYSSIIYFITSTENVASSSQETNQHLLAYYQERQELGYIDEYMEPIDPDNAEDWNKAMYHNYMRFIKKIEIHTKIPTDYIPPYHPD